ncbi:Bromodomain-containing protein 1, partial [Coemansia spiralis]
QRDPRGVLARPVSEDDAPDYYQVIKEPMDFGTMRAKLLDGAYPDLPDFERDLELVVANCLRYNKPATYYYRLATRIKAHIARLLTDARRSIATLPIDPASGCLMVPLSPEIFSLTLDMPAPPSPLREASDASVAEEPNESEEPTPEASKEPEGPAEPMATPTRPQTRSRASSSTPRARRPAATRDQGRRLTLFEQLSLPPPDVRQMLRGRFALAHPEAETAPDSDIPDDINVLATRLRAGSQRPTPAAPDTPTGKRKRDAWTIPTAERLGEDPGAYPAGTAVWAKMESYPWFPAETCDPTAPSVPDTVRAMARLPDATALVQFFAAAPAAARQWRWVSPRQICRLGADPAVDADFFRARKAKSSNMVRSVRLAYAHACDAMGIAPLAS